MHKAGKTDIAVIGMACRFPGASSHEAFWENLKAGISGIEVVPGNRWNWENYWGDPLTEKNKSNSKWGGFLTEVDCFDNDFFGMSATEVERMDPQQRIMLELTWNCMEDAGIRPAELSGKKAGVFVGVFNFDYKELQERNGQFAIEAHHSTGTASAIIANRISYYYNLKGPSFPIDTACSSSLNAVHAAVQSLIQGECSVAVAGGINLLLTPTRHISFSKTGMLSPTGSCKTFDDGADGYVRGEGAGLILLKPLEQALADNDNIYGVIKGSAVNHGGKTYSLTYPSQEAQQEVILQAQRMAGVTPDSISYVEAHGTGTPKGDPIEFQALTNAFQSGMTNDKKNYCGLGSVKTNIGHLEAAAGIAGVIKVLKSMQHQQLPPLQNFQKPNHRIGLAHAPFYLVTQLQEWEPLYDSQDNILPRRAGVSSFGFGGTNAHVVLEEAPVVQLGNTPENKSAPFCYMVCLSAKTDMNLLQRKKDLLAWLKNNNNGVELSNICRTLATGREHFQKRTVLLVENTGRLTEKLEALINNEKPEGYFTNTEADKKEDPLHHLFIEMGESITTALNDPAIGEEAFYNKLAVLAELYVNGYNPDWEQRWFGSRGRRISLPAYPFTRTSFWLPEIQTPESRPGAATGNGASMLHPLLGSNISDFDGQKFSTRLTGKEFFIKDHVIKGKQLLPAVACLEMVRAAISESVKGENDDAPVLCLQNIIWARPVVVETKDVDVTIALFEEEDGGIAFDVISDMTGDDETVYSQGIANFEPGYEHNSINITEYIRANNRQVWNKEQCYSALTRMGFAYGPGHQSLAAVHAGQQQYLAQLLLPPAIADTAKAYFLHPSILDGALQAALLAEAMGEQPSYRMYLPFALDRIEMITACTSDMWAVIRVPANSRQGPVKRLDIDLYDREGKLCVRMQGVCFKLREEEKIEERFLLFAPQWQEKPAPAQPAAGSYAAHLLVVCEPGHLFDHTSLQSQLPGARMLLLQGASEHPEQRFSHYTRKLYEEIQHLLKQQLPGEILVQIVICKPEAADLLRGLSGLLKTLSIEHPAIKGQLIEIGNEDNLIAVIKANGASADTLICYANGSRQVAGWKELPASPTIEMPWKEGGVYLITGGAGGLGLIVANEIATKTKNVSLILTGRSILSNTANERLNTLRSTGARVAYHQVDVSDKRALAAFIQTIQTDYKGLHGIIHSAGIVKDDFILRKSNESVQQVLAPKVSGVTYLDELTKNIPLDFFILFSSIVGPLGNTGQADYAAANGYLDGFAHWRNEQVAMNKRQGKTLAINWPLWKEGGMQISVEMQNEFRRQMQMELLGTADGIQALYQSIQAGVAQVLVAPGQVAGIRKRFLSEEPKPAPITTQPLPVNKTTSLPATGVTEQEAIQYFKQLLAGVIKRPVDQIEAGEPMDAYGIDSIMIMQLTNRLETVFGSLPKTLFFEYQNIQDLTGYFLDRYKGKLDQLLKPAPLPAAATLNDIVEENRPVPIPSLPEVVNRTVRHQPRLKTKKKAQVDNDDAVPLDIAIIGLAGRYPQADNLQEFWNNLANGKDCITEIPADRWDYRLYFDADKEAEGKSYSKWGGFLNDVDKFDPLFFNISPLEAERMDPQERLFLQCVYETIEDAGYTRHSLANGKKFGLGNQVGVFVGVMYEEYQLYGAEEVLQGRPVALWGLPSSIANRVSYFCDFHGPSMAVDTMCSSSLTAIHLACESIVRGNCEVAVAGGVNVSVHPNKYIFLSQGRFASSKGRCESFGTGGDGYVPGEGVGAVLLKPLHKAIADGDHIYGVIKSTAVNHGGKTNGYTVPNIKAQAGAIAHAFKGAGIAPRAISYIEAHGTGTSLGDPIEIAGLTKAMEEHTPDRQFCAIGSVKSNIGHCESAAGIAGVTKILLQLKHKKIVPSLHSAVLNEHIDFTATPFVVQQGLSDWHRPVIGVNGHAKEYPRYAGISSFGAGGANAHLVIEEYMPAERLMLSAEHGTRNTATNEPEIIVLSALDENRLKEKAKQLSSAIREGDSFWNMTSQPLRNIACTLQVGREQLEHRLAMVVATVEELAQKLDAFCEGKHKMQQGIYEGIGSGRKTATADTTNDSQVTAWMNNKQFDEVAAWWVRGSVINWNAFYKNGALLQKVSLPVYPFKKERYWIERSAGQPGAFQTGEKQTAFIHPLLHENITDLTGQRFRASFTGQEFFLKDHLVKGQKVLPAAACLEMVREAVAQSVQSLAINPFHIQIKDVSWQQPVIVAAKEKRIEVELFAAENGDIIFEVYGFNDQDSTDREVYCQGMAVLHAPDEPASIHATGIAAMQQQCSRVVHKAACYEAFEQIGFQYGHTHRGLEEIHIGNNRLIAKVAAAALAFDKKENFVLHPGLLDAALQATLWWNAVTADMALQMFLPVAVETVQVFQPIPAVNWVSIGNSKANVDPGKRILDIDILTEDGACCVRLQSVMLQAPTASWLSGSTDKNYETWLMLPEWKEKEAVIANAGNPFSKHVVITGGLHTIEKALEAELPGAEVITLDHSDEFTSNSLRVFEKVRTLLKAKEKGRMLLQVLIPAGETSMYAGLSGLLKTAHKENPAFVGQVIRIGAEETVSAVKQRLHENMGMLADTAIRYHKGKREVQEWTIAGEQVRQLIGSGNRPWKDRGVYLITGGAGGLGFIFAKEIAGNIKNATLVLTGRSAPDDKVREKIAALQQTGATVLYKRADVTDWQQVQILVREINAEAGAINGIIHSAGVLRDNYIINKSAIEWKEVLAPKVSGAHNLDEATKEEPLDFFVFFSSVTGAVGNAGQADYATANAFLDEWAVYRNSLVAKGSRHGHTLSINWPLWEDGGMTVDKETTEYLFEAMGMVPLPAKDGIGALYRAFVLKQSQVMVIKGDKQRIDNMIVQREDASHTITTERRTATTTGGQVPEPVYDYFRKLLSSVIRLPVEKIRPDVAMEEYGIDSVMVMKMTGKLEKIFGALSKTLFFEYQTIRQLSGYFWEEHTEKIQEVCGLLPALPAESTAVQPAPAKGLAELLKAAGPAHRTIFPVTTTKQQPARTTAGALDIAIVGVAGRYPQADNLDIFWQNLVNGKDCVTEIPATRWDLNLYYDADKSKTGKTYGKWGGFINGVDEFDPMFFNISPREAALLDPQERLFLQCAYQTVEDAGYNRDTIAIGEGDAKDRNIGVYVGVMYEEYQLYGLQANEKGERTALFGVPSSIANRVSYFYNFSGPSMSVDTMCSSSLTAIHLACQAIQNGDCRAAIAGGVNVSIHPNKYLLLAQGKFISGKGRCEAFGSGGEGYVPAEGVGAVLLKPLAQALEDGDHVYGVIKGTAINHGGKTNGYTVPNPHAQAAVIKKAYQRAGIDPRTISYVEAHGTGTALGDPIEMTGLNKAFREFTPDNQFCAIGSVKSNMGHAESAAGIAGLTKILLQLKHKQLAPSLHAQVLNPHIDFENSPFVVQQQLAGWKRPIVEQNGKTVEGVRRAAISSFGAGGANAHIIIEEAGGQWVEQVRDNPSSPEPVIVLLSAKNDNTVHQLAQQLLNTVQVRQLQDKDLMDIAYTLQAGRDALETRLALVVSSITELTERLTAFINKEEEIEGVFHGRIERDTPTVTLFTDDQELQEVIGKWIERKKYNRLCSVWVKGVAVNWMQLYKSQPVKPKRISLPGYLFAKEKYWAPNGNMAYAPVVEQPKTVARQPEPVRAQQPDEPYQLLTYEELWLEQSITQAMAVRKSTGTPGIKRLACFLSDTNRQEQLVQAFRLIDNSVQLHFIREHDLDHTAGVNAYRQAIRAIIDTHGAIDAFLYLWSLENETFVSNYRPIVYLLQAIGAEKLRNNQVLLAGQWNTAEASLHKCYLESWLGFSRSARLSLPATPVSAIYYEGINNEAAWGRYAKWWWNELQLNQSHEALYKNGNRCIPGTRTTQIEKLPGLLKQGATYLITGGAGGLGLVFAEYLSTQYKANLVLTGRSALTAQKQLRVDKLRDNGSQVIYLQADIGDKEKMTAGLALVRQQLGKIDGVLHAAGIEEEGSIVDRSIQQFEKVLGPKVAGTLLLDEWLQAEPLDFVCYFSSLSAMLGDFGTCDYAVSNRFQMSYAAYRAQLQQAGLRYGRTIAINWPLWKEGGMTFSQEEGAGMYLRSSGQRYLETAEGTDVFNRLLTTGAPTHQLVIPGKASKVNAYLKVVPSVSIERTIANGRTLEEQMHAEIIQLVSDVLKMSTDRIDIQDNLADLGFDSVTLTYFSGELGRRLTIDVVPALFFSYPTIEKLTRYFIKEFPTKIKAVYSTQERAIASAWQPVEENMPERTVAPALPPVQVFTPEKKDTPPTIPAFEPVAIIGMSGRFPEARNIEEMWKILEEGRNAVTEISPGRFDWRAFYDKENIEEGKTNCKWTGQIPGIKEFDPLFFELSPAEARDMDPRQRLLLQEGWKALEDAGYGKAHVEKNRIALYVGVEEGSYATLTKQVPALTSNHNAILAARLSYFLNFEGPVMAINTACSSGLVAAHQAFMSLQNGECDTAVAAAVNLLFTPEPYLMLSQAGMLSDDGTCHTFDRNANGMVPGEAVTVVVMKRLSKAIADGDPIYATIAGSGINYDGKTNGITAPGGLAQTALLQSIYDKYRLDPAQIEYIVTHGTGTKLGDPVEINALRDAFRKYSDKEQYCALTSAKTNFGHTFAASGLVSLISLVQALRHEKIPASLHCVQENEYITRDKSPFYINKTLRAWPAVPGKIRTGGVSAFGMSGTNAHMVVQSYEPVTRDKRIYSQPFYLLPFSAKTNEALQQKLRDMLPVLAQNGGAAMAEISYTLMAGRHHFKHRCAIVAADQKEALQTLKQVITGTEDVNKYVAGVAAKLNREGEAAIQELVTIYQYSAADAERQRSLLLGIAQWYCQGYVLEWELLFPVGLPARVHLPTYPFEQKEYWIQPEAGNAGKAVAVDREIEMNATTVKPVAAPDLEQLIREWEQRQQQGRGPGFDEIRKTISIDEMHYMDEALVERIYNLCVEPKAPPVQEVQQPQLSTRTPETQAIIQTIKADIMEVLAIDQLDESIPFTQYGMDSIKTMKLCARLRKKLSADIQPQLFIAFPTLQSLSAHIITTPTLSL